MKFERRKYETTAVDNLRALLRKQKRVLAVGPTGCGKTVIAAMLLKQAWNYKSVLFVAHRYELIDQAYKTLANVGIKAGVLMAQDEKLHGSRRADAKARVQIASVQTIARRGGPADVDLIVFDEAHRVMADSYQDIARRYQRAHVLGLTATPCRQDNRGLGDFFDELYIIARPSELYSDGYLAEPRVLTAPPEVVAELSLRLKKATMSQGDYSNRALGSVAASSMLVGKVVAEAIRLAPDVPKVVFACNVKHSQRIRDRFRRRGIRAEHIDAHTEPEERERILAGLGNGTIEVVCNVDVLSEGWDLPQLGAVIVARPTRSLARFLQMTGRVMRVWNDVIPLVIDHGNNTIRHQVYPGRDIDWSLDATKKHGGGDMVVKSCVECHVAIPGGCTTCPACGAEQPIDREEQSRIEMEAKLEEVRRIQIDDLRKRVEKVAREKNAPPGWVEKVIAEVMA